MSLFGKLFGRHEAAVAAAPATRDCAHANIAPRWANSADMGIEAKASGWECNSCGQIFESVEAAHNDSTAKDRFHRAFDNEK